MKTTCLQFLLCIIFCTFKAQDGNTKLTECKTLTIKMFNGEKIQDQLTNCIVGLATYGSEYTTAYTNWAGEIANQSRERMQQELDQLENVRKESKEMRQQSFSNMMNDVNINLQNQIQQKNSQLKFSGQKKCPYNSDGDPTTVCTQR